MKGNLSKVVVSVVAGLLLTIGIGSASAAPISEFTAQTETGLASTITVTETQINSTYRITNPARRQFTALSVDLQPGQSVINSTVTTRGTNGRQTGVYAVSAVYTPYISAGRIYWTLASATVNGAAASADWITQINASMSTSWRNFIRTQAGTGVVTGITITDTEIVININ